MRWTDLPPALPLSKRALALSFLLLVTPTAVLGLLALHLNSMPLAVGAGVQLLFGLVFSRVHPVWRPPVSATIIVLYLIGLGWSWLPTRTTADWAVHLGHGVLLFGAVVLLSLHDLARTGAEPLRLANKWSAAIARRRNWPQQLGECRTLPEVISLRSAVREEATPCLALLSDPRPQVQVAALGALEFRPKWRPGEAELVLRTANKTEEPAVRAAAAYALAGVATPELVGELGKLLRDPYPEVRLAAAEALLWDGDRRWPLARDAFHEALADGRLAEDGPLFVGATTVPVAAVVDLTTWASEHPPLSNRAIHTLIEYYHGGLLDPDRPELPSELAAQMLDDTISPGLRIELAALLRDHHLLGPDLLDRMTNLDQPGPMRLFAAEVMLKMNADDPDGVDVLRGLGRQPNRELAIQIGAILQEVLGIEMGMPGGGQLPPPNSKQAADVARRVLAWANGATGDALGPTPGPQSGMKAGSRHGIPGLHTTKVNLPPTHPQRGSASII